jgi:hypothetical protein
MSSSIRNAGPCRREFLQKGAALLGSATILPRAGAGSLPGQALGTPDVLGKLTKPGGEPPLGGATWYMGESEGDGLSWKFPAGAFSKIKYLAADMLLDGDTLVVFSISLQEGEKGRTFRFSFGGLNQCSFRVRMPLAAVDQNRWMLDREGAWLKPMCSGDRVDLAKVDRMILTIKRKGPLPARWCMTPVYASTVDVEKLAMPVLPKGKLLDELGQAALRDWSAKTRSAGELKRRLKGQLESAPDRSWPSDFSRWGGWKSRKLGEGTGFFRTHNDGRRWWLVDPDGYAFWSAGLDCVRVDTDARFDGLETAVTWLPDPSGEFHDAYSPGRGNKSINYLAANVIRAFGKDGWRDRWAQIALAEMKRLRFNTVGNWSEWEFPAKARFPYVRPMNFLGRRSEFVYRDFPDVFHPGFESDAAEFAAQLAASASDPAFIGYFLMNEPTWGFSSELPAAGMLYNTTSCHTRAELSRFLHGKYESDSALSAAWKLPATFAHVESGKWEGILSPEALSDLRDFSVVMVEHYFRVLSQECRKVDPHHLNLGMRWAGLPPEWAVRGMKFFDVFSLNCYRQKLPREQAEKIHGMLGIPVMVGEWHFGALDAGLPASGIGRLKNQEDRAKAYRVYLEDAAADPWCVGVHWFTLYDQSALGRSDGENYNIGFLDVCNRPYEELGKAAIASHERMYLVAGGRAKPFEDAPEYLPMLFL